MHAPRGLDRALFKAARWVRDHHHLVVVGPTGIGKSWLACALGHKACREGFSVLYKRAGRLFGDLSQARGEVLPRLLTTLERPAADHRRLGAGAALNAERRRPPRRSSTTATIEELAADHQPSPVSRWHEVVGFHLADATRWTASMHRAHRIELKDHPCADIWSPPATLHDRPCSDRPRVHSTSPRAAPSLAKALRGARVPSMDSWTIRSRLDRPHHARTTTLMSAAWSAVTIRRAFAARDQRDHDHRNR